MFVETAPTLDPPYVHIPMEYLLKAGSICGGSTVCRGTPYGAATGQVARLSERGHRAVPGRTGP